MSQIKIVLTPNVETAEDFNRIGQQLSDIALDYLNRFEHEFIPENELKPHLDAILIWKEFGRAFYKGTGTLLTREEISCLPFSMLDNTIKFMIDRGFLKEIHIEWSLADEPLCPFCRKPYAYPIKTKKLLFFSRIAAWSCANENCRMYGQHYNLHWY